jgi:two-component system, LytTR family, sensor kinase
LHLILQAAVAADVWSHEEVVTAAVGIPTGLFVAFLVYQLVRRVPWPRPFRLRFLALHILAAPIAGATWGVIAVTIRSLILRTPVAAQIMSELPEYVYMGLFFYVIVAGLSYAVEGSARAARAEAIAAHTQLAALRAQLQPHFLFNALHTVVQLIHIEPQRAAEAAELVAGLLRTTLEEKRDEVTLGDEWSFVSRYLAVERIRFGERLIVCETLPDELLDERVPAYALQTLVENAVHHGAAPRAAATEITVSATSSESELTLSVSNTGDGRPARPAETGAGTGLARLRERLAVLYGSAAKLATGPVASGGYEAVLVVPLHRASGA